MYCGKMSIFLNQLNILFYIFLLLKFLNITSTASIYYNGPTNSLDVSDDDNKDYWEDDLSPTERPNMDDYSRGCRPYAMTTAYPPSSKPCYQQSQSQTINNRPISNADAEDVVRRITKLLRCMRGHVTALVRNMNELERDIMPSQSSTNMQNQGCKLYTNALSDNLNNNDKLGYPDVLSEAPGFVINEWSVPIKTDYIAENEQTNEFVAEAQEAVKSWKQQIEICKAILDNAVRSALRVTNKKTPVTVEDFKPPDNKYPSVAPDKLAGSMKNSLNQLINLKDGKEKIQQVRSNKKHKYHGIYDSFRIKEEDK